MSRLKRLIQEIHRRSLWQVLGIYIGGAWVTLQGIEALVSVLGLPEWVPGVALVLLIVGLPIVLATAFVQEGAGAGEAAVEAPAEVERAGLHLVLTWRNVVLGGVMVVALAGVGVAGWFLLGGEISRSPETIRSIAVLPLENLTGDPGQEYFADGMTEAVISEFARLGALSVISRTSVMRYKESDKSLPEIAQELNVQGVIEGSVFRASDRVRITLQLIDARNDLHLWAQTYERDLSDVLVLQSDVARTVAEQIRLELTPEEQTALTTTRTVDPQAYDAYLQGLRLRGGTTAVRDWGPEAIEQFERAVGLDPNFAEGWVQLSGARLSLGVSGFERSYRGEFAKAREAAERALELDDHLGGAHAVLGGVRLWYDWDLAGARRAYERALQLSPSAPAALSGYAWYLLLVEGRTEEGLGLMEQLLRVAPFDVFWRSERFRYFYYARHYQEALEEVERTREVDPNVVDMDIGNIYFIMGRVEEGRRAFNAYWERCGTPCEWSRKARERGWAEGGAEGRMRAWLETAIAREGHSPWHIALTYAGFGETDEALAWLERGYRERDPLMLLSRVHFAFDPLRSDPRFDDLLRRIGFPGSTAADIAKSKEEQETYLFVHEGKPAFTIPIPAEFRREATTGPEVFSARAGASSLTIAVIKVEGSPNLSTAAPGYTAFLMEFGDGRAELMRETRTKLPDDTPAVEFVIKWFTREKIALTTQVLVVERDGYFINIATHTWAGNLPDKKMLYGLNLQPVLSAEAQESASSATVEEP